MRESMPTMPRSPYAVAKLAAEGYTRVFAGLYGMRTVSLRYFNVFGPRQDPTSAYAAAIHVATFGQNQLTLHVTNLGYVPWDMAPGAQLLLHYRWARHAESVTGVVAVPAPAIRSAGQADIQVPGILAPDGAGWRLEVTAELTGPNWAEELGSGARDVQQLSEDDSAVATGLRTRDRPPAR
jgi:hypothetical protein